MIVKGTEILERMGQVNQELEKMKVPNSFKAKIRGMVLFVL